MEICISLLLLLLFLIFHKDNSTIDRFYHNVKMFPMHCSVFFSVFFDAWTLNAVIRNRSVRGHWLGTTVDLLLINNKHYKCSKPILFGGNLAFFSQSDVRFSPGTKAIVFSVRTKSQGNALVHSRVGQSVESALIALAAISLAHSAYFNNFRQKITYFDASRQKRVLFDSLR